MVPYDARITTARASSQSVHVSLADGRELQVPLTWFPRLHTATPTDLALVEVGGAGLGLHWPALDEDISLATLLGPHDLPA